MGGDGWRGGEVGHGGDGDIKGHPFVDSEEKDRDKGLVRTNNIEG